MSNFPLSYKLSWLPRLLRPSLGGSGPGFAPGSGTLPGPLAQRTVRLAFIGDISGVANRRPPDVDAGLRALLRSVDLVIGNCESPVVKAPARRLATRLGFRHALHPELLAGILDSSGIDPGRLVLSIANNHALDQGVAGFEETVAVLAAMGIAIAGSAAAGPLLHVGAGPLGIGLFAFSQWRNAPASAVAGRVTMLGDVDDWSGTGSKVDMICALPHWDREFRHFPAGTTRRLARKLVCGGASLVVGHHAHVLQPLQRIDGSLVAYGMGDFLGTVLARGPWPERIGAVLVVEIGADAATRGRLVSYRIQPFLRIASEGQERLVDIAAVDGRRGRQVRARLARLFGESPLAP